MIESTVHRREKEIESKVESRIQEETRQKELIEKNLSLEKELEELKRDRTDAAKEKEKFDSIEIKLDEDEKK